ncbi:MAG TPA: CHASE domain-containing protein [Telluria sp.]
MRQGKVFAVVLPVYRRGAPLRDAAARRLAYIGDTVAVFDAGKFARQVCQRVGVLEARGLHLNVYAAGAPYEAALVFRHGPAAPLLAASGSSIARLLGYADVVMVSGTVAVARVPWHLVVSHDPSGRAAANCLVA